MRIGVVFNPRSGSRKSQRLYRALDDHLVADGHEHRVFTVTSGTRLEEDIVRNIDELDVVVAVGGDGTLNGVVNGILASDRPDVPVAFCPAGRGKDAARTLPSFSLDHLRHGGVDWETVHKIDVGLAQTSKGDRRYFINVSDIGLSAEAAGFASKMPRQLGASSYMLGAIGAFLSTKATSVRVCVDEDHYLELNNVLMLSICNGRSFGGGIYVAPEASADDGLLDLVAVRNANLLDLLLNLPKLRKGTGFEHPALSSWSARSISVEACDLAPIDLDGDLWGSVPVTFTVMPSVLNWIGPSS